MAYIKVDHSKFEKAADEIDAYVKLMKEKMASMQSETIWLSFSWQGKDATQFKEEFRKVNDDGSVHAQMIKSLESYAKYLRFVAQKYKDVQANAVNRANSLPRW